MNKMSLKKTTPKMKLLHERITYPDYILGNLHNLNCESILIKQVDYKNITLKQ